MMLMNSPSSTLPSFLADVDFFSRMVIALVTMPVYRTSSASAGRLSASASASIRKERIFFMAVSSSIAVYQRAVPASTSEQFFNVKRFGARCTILCAISYG